MTAAAASLSADGMSAWLLAAPRWRACVDSVEWLSGPEVAELLDVHHSTVHRIPADQLPYEETPGGSLRRGRRRYRAEDVERYRKRRSADLSDRVEAAEARIAELEAWRDRMERE